MELAYSCPFNAFRVPLNMLPQSQQGAKDNQLVADILAELTAASPIVEGYVMRQLNYLRRKAYGTIKHPARSANSIATEPRLTGTEQIIVTQLKALKLRYKPLDQHYREQYRGSYRLNYILAPVAVALAVLSMLLLIAHGQWFHHQHQPAITAILVVFGLVKLFLLSIMLLNTQQANKLEFNKRASTYRTVLEHLRIAQFISVVGTTRVPEPLSDAVLWKKWKKNSVQQFVADAIASVWQDLENTGRQPILAPTKSKLLEVTNYLKKAWVAEQKDYQERRAANETARNARYEHTVERFSVLVITIVLFDLAVGVVCLCRRMLPHGLGEVAEWVEHNPGPVLIALTAVLPAIVASYNALRFQTEAKTIAHRAHLMLEILADKMAELLAIEQQIKDATSHDLSAHRAAVVNCANAIAQTMIEELFEWTFISTKDVYDTA
jgi:hypothetical protein